MNDFPSHGDNFETVTDPDLRDRVLAASQHSLPLRLLNAGFRDLGWMNGWGDERPKELAFCAHQLRTRHNDVRCVSLSYCEHCRFFFQVDSSG